MAARVCQGVDQPLPATIIAEDANQDMAQGQALDLLLGSCLTADQRITAGTMATRIQPTAVHVIGVCRTASSAPASANGSAKTE